MRIVKKLISVISAAAIMMTTSAFASVIPDHRGTNLDQFETGTHSVNKTVKSYSNLFRTAGEQYGIDPNILSAVCMQESGGVNYSYRADGTPYPAWGIMQIEYTNEKAYAAFGLDTAGVSWTLEDRLDPEKAIPYAAYILSESLYKYDNDYAKMLQAYNFGDTVLGRIISAHPDTWLDERANAKSYVSNWPYSSYGDAQYIEHVLRYYKKDIEYDGAKVRINDKLLKFSNQYPIVRNGRTLIPVRAISEYLGANVSWNEQNQVATITKGRTSIEICIGQAIAYINGVEYTLDVPAEKINNRTMVPLRFIAEAFNLDVEWNGETSTVEITC